MLTIVEASSIVEGATGLSFVSGSPHLKYSEKMPRLLGKMRKDPDRKHLLPVDVLFGSYNPSRREVRIFHRNVKMHSDQPRWNSSVLEEVVLLHETAHAIVHDGVESQIYRSTPLEAVAGGDKSTSRDEHERRSSEWYKRIPRNAHEQIAQAITLNFIRSRHWAEHEEVFFDLMRFQEWQYRLPERVAELLQSGKDAGRALAQLIQAMRANPIKTEEELWRSYEGRLSKKADQP